LAQCKLASPDSWALGANGNWGVSANWSSGVYPDSPGTSVCVTDNTSTVTLDVNATVGSLHLGVGNSVLMSPGTSLDVAGSQLINSGHIYIDAGSGKNTVFSISDNVTMSGGVLPIGVLDSGLNLNSGNGGTAYVRGAGHTLTNYDNLIQGSGYIGDDGLKFVNGAVGRGDNNGVGEIWANTPGGTLNIGAGGGSFTNYFAVEVFSGSTLEVTANNKGFNQIGGITDVFGTLIVPHGFTNAWSVAGPQLPSSPGILDGNGTIIGNVVNGGTVVPEYYQAALTIMGKYDQLATGSLTVFFQGNSQLNVDGAVLLDGALNVFSNNGSKGTIPIMTFASASGNFSALNLDNSPCASTGADTWICGHLKAKEIFGATELTLNINGIPEPSTWAMMLVGFAGLGFAGYRTRRATISSP
jgi:hypothetical protein